MPDKEARFYSAANRELSARSFGSHMEDGQAAFYYQVNLPEDGQVAMSFYERVDNFDVPFDLSDIPMPSPPPAADGRGLAAVSRRAAR
ncbi:MAG: hypothetical protein WD118_11090 [Phycisphaeraceae bacterium]